MWVISISQISFEPTVVRSYNARYNIVSWGMEGLFSYIRVLSTFENLAARDLD